MRTPKLQVTGINHVVLHVGDLERAKRFYIDVLGFEEMEVTEGPEVPASFLSCGRQGIDLFEVRGAEAYGGKEMNHVALSVASEDLDEIIAELAKAGVTDAERTPRNSVFVRDPDGHRIEVLPLSTAAMVSEFYQAQRRGEVATP